MTDERLRKFERRWKETGAVEDEAAWLRERVRVGDLAQSKLELAAYCGHPAARLVGGKGREGADVLGWLEGLDELDSEAMLRGRLGMALELAELWGEGCQGHSLEPLVFLAEDYVVCPCEKHERRLRDSIFECVGRLDLNLISRLPQRQAQAMLHAVLGTACDIAGVSRHEFELPPGFGFSGAGDRDYGSLRRFVLATLRVATETELRAAIADWVGPWALGHKDPIRDRVEARSKDGAHEPGE